MSKLSKSGELVYSPRYDLSDYKQVLSAEKFKLLYDELKYERWSWHTPDVAAEETLALVHTKAYLKDFLSAHLSDHTLRAEVPIDKRIVEAVRTATQGTILAAELAVRHGLAVNLSGGFHHSFAEHAEGFCYLNDTVIAIRHLRQTHALLKVLVIDLDVHQGNGTAFLLKDDPLSFTFSMHEKDNYPAKKQSSLDVDLASFMRDAEYLQLLSANLAQVRSRFAPDLIFYLAGADVYKDDTLGGLELTMDGIAERDRIVRDFMPEVPLVMLPAGGYARQIIDTVKIHARTIRILHGRAA
ncbi:MAG: histone deacetylase [Spirochaetes bacterium]|nr:histone deacetylase [Spirochaetota bacterium]